MDRFPILWKDRSAGELSVEREGLYTCFSARCCLPQEGLWCVWAVGEQGELRLGVLEPARGGAVIRRRFSGQMTAPLGRVLRGELRPAGQRQEDWLALQDSERLFRSPWLRRQLHGVQGAMTWSEEQRRHLALPYDPKKPFPLTAMFCFARLEWIRGRAYLVFSFDREEWPCF